MYDTQNKVVLVTGGATGLGFLIAKEFVEEGAKFVALLDINEEKGAEAEKEFKEKYGSNKARFIKCDVTTSDLDVAYDEVLKEFGYIDVVVNNAGIMKDSPETYLKEIAINFTALITSSLKAYSLMRKDRGGKGGTIVNIASILGLVNLHVLPVYNGTKAGVLKFTTSMGMEPHYSRSDVRFICLCYGATDTPLLTECLTIDKETQEEYTTLLNEAPAQSPVKTAKSSMSVFKTGDSGTVWVIASNKPPKDVTELFVNIDQIVMKHVME